MRYPVARPNLAGNELRYVTHAVESSWVSSHGEFIDLFEASLREFLGVEHLMVCTSGTAALHLGLLGLGIGPGDEVIVPSLTYVASANAVAYTGAAPVFADSLEDSWCLDPDSVRRLITPRTKAIMPVHLYGQMCDMDALDQLAREHDLVLIEDAAEALGSSLRGQPAGSIGDAAGFSFFGNKLITTGEGGVVIARDPAVMERIRLIGRQGMDPTRRYWHSVLGFNYRMTNLAAALGVAQMERVHDFLAHRGRLAEWYRRRLAHVPGVRLPAPFAGAKHAHWMYGILLNNRDEVADELLRRGIETRPFFPPIHEFPMYRAARSDGGCPVAVDLARRGLCLPSYFELMEDDVDVIVREIGAVVQDLFSGEPEATADSISCDQPGIRPRSPSAPR